MPKKAEPKQNAWSVTFVQCELDKATKELVKKHDPTLEATLDGIDRLIADGYKVSISHDSYHDCVGVFLTMPDKSHPHAGQCLTARGPNWIGALKVLVYKHYTILDGNWGASVNQERERSDWG